MSPDPVDRSASPMPSSLIFTISACGVCVMCTLALVAWAYLATLVSASAQTK
jgi:hypothetical protein